MKNILERLSKTCPSSATLLTVTIRTAHLLCILQRYKTSNSLALINRQGYFLCVQFILSAFPFEHFDFFLLLRRILTIK